MRRPIICSALLHLGALMFVILGIYDPFKRSVDSKQSTVIDFVAVSEYSQAPMPVPTSNVQAPKRQEPAQKPPKIQPPKPPEKRPSPKASVKPKAPPPTQKSSPSSSRSRAAPSPAPKTPAPPPPAPKPAKIRQEKPIPSPQQAAVEKKPTASKKAWLDLKEEEALLSELGREESAKPSEPQQEIEEILEELADVTDLLEEASPPGAQAADRLGDVVTATEIDAIRRHVARCWIVPHGVRGARDLTVDIAMRLRQDATVYEAKIVNAHRMQQDPLFRAAAESARRAVLDPQCNPFPLPPEKYQQWKNIELTFNPKEMH